MQAKIIRQKHYRFPEQRLQIKDIAEGKHRGYSRKVKFHTRRRSLNNSVIDTESSHHARNDSESRKLITEAASSQLVRPFSSQVRQNDSQRSRNQSQLRSMQQSANSLERSPIAQRQRCFTQPAQQESEEIQCRLSESKQKDFTSVRVINANFNHHNSDTCVCNLCDCGRHLCKLHVIEPQMHPSTMYRSHYQGAHPMKKLQIKPKQETTPLEGPFLDLNSMYSKEYNHKQVEGNRPRPEDQLSMGGPSAGLTTYAAEHPGFKGGNQYVKPTNNTSINGILSFGQSGTVYQRAYVPMGRKDTEKFRRKGYFKSGEPWLGNTTYNQAFSHKSKGQPSKSQKQQEKLEKKLGFSHQYETTYRNEFKLNQPVGCPAKLQLRARGSQMNKLQLTENAEFRSINPHFSPISLTNFHLN